MEGRQRSIGDDTARLHASWTRGSGKTSVKIRKNSLFEACDNCRDNTFVGIVSAAIFDSIGREILGLGVIEANSLGITSYAEGLAKGVGVPLGQISGNVTG